MGRLLQRQPSAGNKIHRLVRRYFKARGYLKGPR